MRARLPLALLVLTALLACGAWSHSMTTYSGADVFESAFTLPDDSAPPTAAQVNPALEALGDRTKWTYNRLLPFLPNGGSFPLFIAGRGEQDDALASQPSTSSASYVSLYPLLTEVDDARVGDMAITIVRFTCALSFSGGSPTQCGARFKLQDTQNGGGAADLCRAARVDDIVEASGQHSHDITLLGFRQITVAGPYVVNLLGSVTLATASQVATIIGSGGGFDTGIDAVTLLIRPAPNP